MKEFVKGLKLGIPIGLGYLSVSFTFGIMAVSFGFYWWQAVMISAFTLTSAGQFEAIHTMLNPGHYAEMLISQFTINIRYSFMSISLSQKLAPSFKGIKKWIAGFFITDEIFAVSNSQEEVTGKLFAGLCVFPWIGWTLGTLMGALLGNVLPEKIMVAMSLAIYGMFVAIVAPAMAKDKAVVIVVITAVLLSVLFKYAPYLKNVSSGIAISACAVTASALGAWLFPVNTPDTPKEDVNE